MDNHPLIGKQLGNWILLDVIGQGGMGTVFVARHRFLDDRVALKVLNAAYADHPVVAQRFFREARTCRELEHPSIVKVLDFGQAESGELYLVMELVQGRSLATLLRTQVLDEPTAARVAMLIADALVVAHARGIIHRDLKPANLVLVGNGVKLLDFGVAKVITAEDVTMNGVALGTPAYMAPEQAQGARDVGPAADIYALGALLYKMLTGRVPFEGRKSPDFMKRLLREPPPPPSRFGRVSSEMEQLILECLEKDPASRPPNMVLLRDRLAQLAGPESLGELHFMPTMMWEGEDAQGVRRTLSDEGPGTDDSATLADEDGVLRRHFPALLAAAEEARAESILDTEPSGEESQPTTRRRQTAPAPQPTVQLSIASTMDELPGGTSPAPGSGPVASPMVTLVMPPDAVPTGSATAPPPPSSLRPTVPLPLLARPTDLLRSVDVPGEPVAPSSDDPSSAARRMADLLTPRLVPRLTSWWLLALILVVLVLAVFTVFALVTLDRG